MKNVFLKKISAVIGVFLSVAIILGTVPARAMPTEESVPALELDCKSAILIEASTGKVLYEKDADMALPPASVTKVMTLLLVMEAIEEGRIKYGDSVRASANACSMGGSQIYLKENEEMSVEDMLKSVVIASANDAAVALAEHIAGSEEEFVRRMNKRAEELGMKNTRFENTNGLDDTTDSHLTSARDIAIMSRELIKYPKILEYSSTWMDSVRGGAFGLTNTNRLVRFYKGATGLKTGSTAKAGFCISATAERDGMGLICVIMGAPSRDVRNAAAVRLFDYGFSNYALYRDEGGTLPPVKVAKGEQSELIVKCGGFSAVMKKSEIGAVKKEISLPEQIDAPIEKGSAVGSVIYKVGENEIGRVDIVATESVDKLDFGSALIMLLRKCACIL
ncbi:MAG: D-alanyl-D-alanine carboxypeptidase [Clostridia bacterium]|nr:D-alanyl-D-alanine carboxypeptidase [Clostridia bacterium]